MINHKVLSISLSPRLFNTSRRKTTTQHHCQPHPFKSSHTTSTILYHYIDVNIHAAHHTTRHKMYHHHCPIPTHPCVEGATGRPLPRSGLHSSRWRTLSFTYSSGWWASHATTLHICFPRYTSNITLSYKFTETSSESNIIGLVQRLREPVQKIWPLWFSSYSITVTISGQICFTIESTFSTTSALVISLCSSNMEHQVNHQ